MQNLLTLMWFMVNHKPLLNFYMEYKTGMLVDIRLRHGDHIIYKTGILLEIIVRYKTLSDRAMWYIVLDWDPDWNYGETSHYVES